MNEPYSRILAMPWDEMLLAHAEAQEIEAESGPAATLATMLAPMLAEMLGG